MANAVQRMVLLFPGKLALRKLFHAWPAPCSKPIPAKSTWLLADYVKWRKVNDRDTRLITYENKLAVKEIAKRAGVPFVPVLAHLDPTSVDINRHPDLQLPRFVLKMNHGFNDIVFVCRIGNDRIRLSGRHVVGDYPAEEANARIRRHFTWWAKNVHAAREWALWMIRPRILFAEPYLPLNDDYKVFVVRGREEAIRVVTERWDRHWGGYFDREWSCFGGDAAAEDLFGTATFDMVNARFPRPANLKKLLSYAERMVPKDMSFLRVDFFLLPDGNFVLGEASAYPAGGGDTAKLDVE